MMTKAEFDIKPAPSEAVEHANPSLADTGNASPSQKPQDELTQKGKTKITPVTIAVGLSAIWAIVAAWLLFSASDPIFSGANTTDIFNSLNGLLMPLALIWLVALAFQRNDPTLERRLAISQHLDKAIAPVEIAEKRLDQVQKNLKKELESIDAVAELASDRINHLETRFQDQVSNLFSVSADAEARATSITHSLTQEREKINALALEITNRFDSIEDKVNTIEEQLDTVSHRASASADYIHQNMVEGVQAFDDATDRLEQHSEKVKLDLKDNFTSVDTLVSDIETRIDGVTSQIHTGLDRLDQDLNTTESRSNSLSENMQEQVRLLADMSEQAVVEGEKVRSILDNNINTLNAGAKQALETSKASAEDILEQTALIIARFEETAEAVKLKTEAASQELLSQRDLVAETIDQTEKQARIQGEKLREIFEQDRAKTSALLAEQAEQLQAFLDDTVNRISIASEAGTIETRKIAEDLLNQIRTLRQGLEQQMEDLRDSGHSSINDLLDAAEKVANSTNSMTAMIENAQTVTNTSADQIQSQSFALGNLLDGVETQLTELTQSLSGQTKTATESVTDAENVIKSVAETIQRERRVIQLGVEGLNTSLFSAENQMLKARDALLADSKKLRDDMAETGETFNISATNYSNERVRIRQETEEVVNTLNTASQEMGNELKSFSDSSIDAAERLNDASRELKNQTEAAEKIMRAAADDARHSLTTSMDDITDRATVKVTGLQEELQATLTRLLTEYKNTVQDAERESAHLATRLGREADRIADDADRFVAKTEEIQRRLSKQSKNDFSRTSALLMESLQSGAIDIHKGLFSDIPDDMWEKYMAGDKSLFARRTIKLADRATRKAIATKFKQDIEFREATTRFMNDFQGLMERAMFGDRGNALSVTLISSDMGKLYVLLGQALKKFS